MGHWIVFAIAVTEDGHTSDWPIRNLVVNAGPVSGQLFAKLGQVGLHLCYWS